MRKKSMIAIMSVIVIITVVVCGGIFVNTNNLKNQLQEVKGKATVIDVTELVIGEETEHEHVYKTTYDEENHWEECIYCNEKRNMIVHNFTTTWALRI